MEEGTQRGVDHVGMVMKKDTVIFPCVLVPCLQFIILC